jgi:hypothetical protein
MQIFFISLIQTNFGHHAPGCATIKVMEPEHSAQLQNSIVATIFTQTTPFGSRSTNIQT